MDELISKRTVIEAIEKARANVGHNLERSIGKSIIEILDDVGRDVDRLPPAELGTNLAEVGTDLISRQMLLEYIHGEPVGRLLCDKYNLDGLIEQFPSAQPEINCSEFPNNSDTISREAVADAINGIECTRNTTWYEFYQKVITAVEKLPPAQPDIIRCRNCKFASGDSRICMKFGHSPIGELDFCAWAERRTDE